MRCPNRECRATVSKLITVALPDGRLVRGCPECITLRRERVRTGRRIWPSHEVYGVEGVREKNREWAENVAKRAAYMRRTAHHSFFQRG